MRKRRKRKEREVKERKGFKKNTKIPPENNITIRESVRHSVKCGKLSEFSLHLHFRNRSDFSMKGSRMRATNFIKRSTKSGVANHHLKAAPYSEGLIFKLLC